MLHFLMLHAPSHAFDLIFMHDVIADITQQYRHWSLIYSTAGTALDKPDYRP